MSKEAILWAARFVRESNLIENISVSYETIIDLFAQENESGHVGALRKAHKSSADQEPLNARMICEWQMLLMQEQNAACTDTEDLISKRHIGQYRDCEVYIRETVDGVATVKRRCPPAKTVPAKMRRLIRAINTFQARKNSKNPPPQPRHGE